MVTSTHTLPRRLVPWPLYVPSLKPAATAALDVAAALGVAVATDRAITTGVGCCAATAVAVGRLGTRRNALCTVLPPLTAPGRWLHRRQAEADGLWAQVASGVARGDYGGAQRSQATRHSMFRHNHEVTGQPLAQPWRAVNRL